MKVYVLFLSIVFFTSSALGGIFYPMALMKPQKGKLKKKKLLMIKIPKLHLEGIVNGKNKLALINGKFLKEKDKIDSCTVEKIDTKSGTVTVRCGSFQTKLTMNLGELTGEKK